MLTVSQPLTPNANKCPNPSCSLTCQRSGESESALREVAGSDLLPDRPYYIPMALAPMPRMNNPS
ncbi:MAG: hypothetical protein R2778_09530 [Saprospiraceae bacterium]